MKDESWPPFFVVVVDAVDVVVVAAVVVVVDVVVVVVGAVVVVVDVAVADVAERWTLNNIMRVVFCCHRCSITLWFLTLTVDADIR